MPNIAVSEATPLIFLGGLLVMLLITAIIIVVEAMLLNRMNWDEHMPSLRAALLANLLSTPVSLLYLNYNPGWEAIGIAWLFSSLVEGFVLRQHQPRLRWANWIYALLINALSYLVIIAPAYLLRL